MPLAQQPILSLAVDQGALAWALVRWGAAGARVRSGPPIERFLDLRPDETARTIGRVDQGARVVLVLPASWCGVRPVGVPIARWNAAKAELQRSIDGLFPLTSEDALLGLVERTSEPGEPSQGSFLIASSSARVGPWLDAIRRAFGVDQMSVVSPHMALAGLGVQDRPAAEVRERLATGGWVEHRLRWGLLADAGAPTRAPLTGTDSGWALLDNDQWRSLSPTDLCVAAAMAMRTAPGSFAPLLGPSPRVPQRWVPAAALALLAAGVLWAGPALRDWRLQAAINALDTKARDFSDQLAQASSDYDAAMRLGSRINDAQRLTPADAPDLLDELARVQQAVPAEGFLYRVELSTAAVTLKGECRRAGDVLRALNASPALRNPQMLDAPVAIEERGLELFHVRAERAGPPSDKLEAKGGTP